MEREDISASDKMRIDELARKAVAWLESKEGREKMGATLREAREFGQKLSRARRIDPEKLRRPVTI